MITEKLLTVADHTEWQAILSASLNVFGSVEYARIVQAQWGYQPRLFVLERDDAQIAYPLFLRPIHALPFAAMMPGEWWDALTPEYTGPLRLHSTPHAIEAQLPDRFARFCRDHGIVTEFAHLHPWNWQPSLLEPDRVSLNREIIYIDLSCSDERLWQESFSHACRKNINRAQREGVQIFAATSADHVREFHRIYTQTMARNQAAEQYYFSLAYFMAFFETMPHHARFVLAAYGDQVIAATLYLHDDNDVYSYLGGADPDFQHVRPTNAVVYETIRWARSANKRRLILGGGYRADDGIFRFKSSFSPLRARFYVYRRIHLAEEYEQLCSAWSSYYGAEPGPDNYFPAYRSQPIATPLAPAPPEQL